MLSDPASTIIHRFGLLNPEYPEGNPAHGVPYPMTFFIDEGGVIRSRFFEGTYSTRRTAGSMLALQGEAIGPVHEARAEHVTVRTSCSNESVFPGNRVTLILDLDLEPGFHAYAPGATGYRQLQLQLEPDPLLSFGAIVYPAGHAYFFKPLRETVSVYENRVRLARDATIATGKDINELLRSPKPTLTIRGSLDYQVCSDRVCYPPQNLPLSWTLRVQPLDRERSPESLRKR